MRNNRSTCGCHNNSWGIVLTQLHIFLVLHLPPARIEIEVKWCFLALMVTEAVGTLRHTLFPWTLGWLIELHTTPQVPPIFALTETHFRHMFSTLAEEACFPHKSWKVLRLEVAKEGCRFLFLLYKLALRLSCLCSHWNSNQWRKKQKWFLLRK